MGQNKCVLRMALRRMGGNEKDGPNKGVQNVFGGTASGSNLCVLNF